MQTVYQFPSSSFFACMCLFVALQSCHDNLHSWLMAALQAQTKLSSNEPGVCPRDLRGAATANKTHKAPRPWHWPSPRLPAILPLPHTAACCFVPAPSRGSSSHPLLEVVLPPMPLSHKDRAECTHTCTHTFFEVPQFMFFRLYHIRAHLLFLCINIKLSYRLTRLRPARQYSMWNFVVDMQVIFALQMRNTNLSLLCEVSFILKGLFIPCQIYIFSLVSSLVCLSIKIVMMQVVQFGKHPLNALH